MPIIISLKDIHLYVLLKTATYVECKAKDIQVVKVCKFQYHKKSNNKNTSNYHHLLCRTNLYCIFIHIKGGLHDSDFI